MRSRCSPTRRAKIYQRHCSPQRQTNVVDCEPQAVLVFSLTPLHCTDCSHCTDCPFSVPHPAQRPLRRGGAMAGLQLRRPRQARLLLQVLLPARAIAGATAGNSATAVAGSGSAIACPQRSRVRVLVIAEGHRAHGRPLRGAALTAGRFKFRGRLRIGCASRARCACQSKPFKTNCRAHDAVAAGPAMATRHKRKPLALVKLGATARAPPRTHQWPSHAHAHRRTRRGTRLCARARTHRRRETKLGGHARLPPPDIHTHWSARARSRAHARNQAPARPSPDRPPAHARTQARPVP